MPLLVGGLRPDWSSLGPWWAPRSLGWLDLCLGPRPRFRSGPVLVPKGAVRDTEPLRNGLQVLVRMLLDVPADLGPLGFGPCVLPIPRRQWSRPGSIFNSPLQGQHGPFKYLVLSVAEVSEEQSLPIWANLGREATTNNLGQTVGGTALQIQEVEIENACLVGDVKNCVVVRQEKGPYFMI